MGDGEQDLHQGAVANFFGVIGDFYGFGVAGGAIAYFIVAGGGFAAAGIAGADGLDAF